MVNRMRDSGPVRRLGGLWSGFVDTFLRDNKVIPAVLALLALFVFAWVVAGIFLDTPEQTVSNQANFAQQQESPGNSEPLAPDVENRDVESYAAYQSKDPFRQLLAPAESTQATTPETTIPEGTSFEETTSGPGGTGAGGGGAGGGGGRGGGAGGGGGGGRGGAGGQGGAGAGGGGGAGGAGGGGRGGTGGGAGGGLPESGGGIYPPR